MTTEIIETTAIQGATVQAAPAITTAPALLSPAQQIAKGTEIANALADLIEKQKLYTIIQGKKYVKVDAWVCLGSMDGVFPRERYVKEMEDGSFEVYIELVEKATGMVVGGSSSICAMDEKRWKNADKFARRSMAGTRATGKAFRLHYSWVMCLAGYEATPAEEMPEHLTRTPVDKTFTGTDTEKAQLAAYLKNQKLNDAQADAVLTRMLGKKSSELEAIIQDVTTAS